MKNEMKVQHSDEEPTYFSEPVFDALEHIIDTQHKIIKYTKGKDTQNYIKY